MSTADTASVISYVPIDSAGNTVLIYIGSHRVRVRVRGGGEAQDLLLSQLPPRL
jgi:hypothetical protein